MMRPVCTHPYHAMYMEREMRCPVCRRSGWQSQIARETRAERRQRRADTQLAVHGISRAFADLVRHVWLFIKLQVHR